MKNIFEKTPRLLDIKLSSLSTETLEKCLEIEKINELYKRNKDITIRYILSKLKPNSFSEMKIVEHKSVEEDFEFFVQNLTKEQLVSRFRKYIDDITSSTLMNIKGDVETQLLYTLYEDCYYEGSIQKMSLNFTTLESDNDFRKRKSKIKIFNQFCDLVNDEVMKVIKENKDKEKEKTIAMYKKELEKLNKKLKSIL